MSLYLVIDLFHLLHCLVNNLFQLIEFFSLFRDFVLNILNVIAMLSNRFVDSDDVILCVRYSRIKVIDIVSLLSNILTQSL